MSGIEVDANAEDHPMTSRPSLLPIRLIALLPAGLLSSALLHAAPDAIVTSTPAQPANDTIIVTATRLQQIKSEIGSSISVITRDDIEAQGFDFAVDAVASAPGVTVNQNGAFGGTASVRIRGAGSEQTLVLIDGVAVNDPTAPGGGFDFARIDTDNIERIEILKGPQSTLWGTDAIGGVVAITTRRPQQGLGGQAFAEFGAYDTLRGGAALEAANERADVRLAVTATDSDGISKADSDNGNTEEDGYQATTLATRGGVNLGGDARLDLTLLWTDVETEFDSFVFGSPGNVGDGDEVSETEELSGHLALTVPLFDGRLENQVLLGYSDIERENFSNGASTFTSEGDRTIYRYQGTFNINSQQRLAFGAEREDNEANGESSTIDGIFALYELSPIESLTLTAGIRSDDVENFGSETTGRIAAAFAVTEQVTLHGSWGEGFKAPTIFQTTFFCCGASAPNADLQPETSDAFDFGVTWRSSDARAEVDLTYFEQDTENLINFSFAVGGYENIAEAESEGIELSASYQLTEWLGLTASYAYIDATDDSGEQLIRVPEHSGDLSLSFDNGGPFSANLLVRHNGDERDSTGEVDSWTRVDLNGRYRFSDSLEFYARVENLLDEDYQQLLGYGTPGLNVSAGARIRF